MRTFLRQKISLLAVLSVFLFSGCLKDSVTKTYTILTPVIKPKQEVLASIKSDDPRTIGSAGKFYLYGNYIFLNEVNKGVHVINNANPKSPQRVAFISIPGNLDIAVKGNVLYADFYMDMLTIDISDPNDAKLLNVVPNLFPERQYGSGFFIDSSQVIVDWQRKDTTVSAAENESDLSGCINCIFDLAYSSSPSKSSAVPGVAGSMSRFAIIQDYLYAVNMSAVVVHDISTPSSPVVLNTKNFGWNIETIYPFKDKLFVGSSTGMFIFSLNDMKSPELVGAFGHANACDPVVADDKYAYVTLRSGSRCWSINNQLDVINVENVMAPSLVKTYNLVNPHGLSLDGDLLFVCDGSAGLKVFNVADPMDLKLIRHVGGMTTYDAIAWNNRLYLVTSNGINQYDYTDAGSLSLLSTININN